MFQIKLLLYPTIKSNIDIRWNINEAINLFRFSALGSLDLSNNDLKSVSASAFQSAPGLKVLILSNNQISQVHDGALAGLSELRTLDLSGNESQLADRTQQCSVLIQFYQ